MHHSPPRWAPRASYVLNWLQKCAQSINNSFTHHVKNVLLIGVIRSWSCSWSNDIRHRQRQQQRESESRCQIRVHILMAIAVKIFNISMHEKWRNSQCSQIRKDRDRDRDRDRATTQSTFLSCTQHVSVLYNKFRQTLAHTQRHGHTLSTQLLTHVYACHIIKHIKHIMGRVCHRHAYTLQPHTHTCLHWW